MDQEDEQDVNSQSTDVDEPFSPMTKETFELDFEKSEQTFASQAGSDEATLFTHPSSSAHEEVLSKQDSVEKFEGIHSPLKSTEGGSSTDLIQFTDVHEAGQFSGEYEQPSKVLVYSEESVVHDDDLEDEGYLFEDVRRAEASVVHSSGKDALDSDATYRFFVGPVDQNITDDYEETSGLSDRPSAEDTQETMRFEEASGFSGTVPEIAVTQCDLEEAVNHFPTRGVLTEEKMGSDFDDEMTSMELDEELIEVIESVYETEDDQMQSTPHEDYPTTEDSPFVYRSEQTRREEPQYTAGTSSPDLVSECDSEVTSSIAETVINTDASMQRVDLGDLMCFDDLTDTSSVDSFSTVVQRHPEIEDRLADFASMSSSYQSEIPTFSTEIPLEQLLRTESVEKDDTQQSGVLEEVEVREIPAESVVYEEDSESGSGILLTSTVLAAISEEDEKRSSSQKTTSSSEKLETDTTSTSSKHLGSSPDVGPADAHKFFGKSVGKRRHLSIVFIAGVRTSREGNPGEGKFGFRNRSHGYP